MPGKPGGKVKATQDARGDPAGAKAGRERKNLFVVTTAAGREGEAGAELRRLLEGAQVTPLFLKGCRLLRTVQPRPEVARVVRSARTRCIGRVIPVDVEVEIPKSRDALSTLALAAESLARFGPEDTFAVRCVRRGHHEFSARDVETTIGRRVVEATRAGVDLEKPRKVVVVEVFQGRAFLGVADADELVRKPLRKARKYDPGRRPLNRAELKFREIVERAELDVRPGMRALDLGAAPGGWSKVLAESGLRVLAVDPADLAPEVAALENVEHFKGRAEDVAAVLAEGRFDILTNDMNAEPKASAHAMCSVAPLLRPRAPAIMTVKFVSCRRKQHVAEARSVLEQAFDDIRVRRVPHNARETTAVMRRRA